MSSKLSSVGTSSPSSTVNSNNSIIKTNISNNKNTLSSSKNNNSNKKSSTVASSASSSSVINTNNNRLARPSTPPRLPPISAIPIPKSILSFGVVCSSNINRSMEAHVVLGNAGLTVESYGTGTNVRLPGRTAMEPRIFKFGTPYSEMYASLSNTIEDTNYFAHNGVLNLCRRGASVKSAPQRWQDTPSLFITTHDVIIAFEERIFDAVVEDLQMREVTQDLAPIHIICLDTKDNPQEAKIQGRIALEICWILEQLVQEKMIKVSLSDIFLSTSDTIHDATASDSNSTSSKKRNRSTTQTTSSKKLAAELLMDDISDILYSFQQQRMTHTPVQILYQLCFL